MRWSVVSTVLQEELARRACYFEHCRCGGLSRRLRGGGVDWERRRQQLRWWWRSDRASSEVLQQVWRHGAAQPVRAAAQRERANRVVHDVAHAEPHASEPLGVAAGRREAELVRAAAEEKAVAIGPAGAGWWREADGGLA
jgi:hypothetical protein